ncbi:hypothetical protein [Streptomyces prunicolor]|uniref:hypothetical protein n=1 Tax=Streptomyces prunicolor TaxID=67348 RepID=UPI0033C0700E
MTDNLVPQTLAPNALILGELKPSVYVRWIDLAMNLGPLDYKEYEWEELQNRWGIGKKPVQRLLNSLESEGWLHQEKTKGVRIYLFPTNDASESHLKRIKTQTDDAWKRNTGKRFKTAVDKQPYRNQYMVEKGNFTKVPETILKDQRLTNMQLATYVVIRCTTNAHSFWGERALAKAAGMAPSTFTEHLKTLKEAGYIVYDGVQRVSNRYDFNDMSESLSVQVESLSVQPEPVSVQMESVSVPINTEPNTEERILTTTTDQSGAAAGKEDQGFPLVDEMGSPGVLDSGTEKIEIPSGDVVDAHASPTPGEPKKSRASWTVKKKAAPSKKVTSDRVPAPRNDALDHQARLAKQAAAHRAEQTAKQELVQARRAQHSAELAKLYGETAEEPQTAVQSRQAQQ